MKHIVDDTERNLAWIVTTKTDDEARILLDEEESMQNLEMDPFLDMFPFSSPLIPTIKWLSYDPSSLKAIKKLRKRLLNLGNRAEIKAPKQYERLLELSRKTLEEIYLDQIFNLEEYISDTTEDIIELVTKQKRLKKRLKKLEAEYEKKCEPKTTTKWNIPDDIELPF